MVPNRAVQNFVRDLTVLDLRNFRIENLMMNDLRMPTFFVYYSTVGGDILGKLMFTDREMIFEPLNSGLKGFYNYGSKSQKNEIFNFFDFFDFLLFFSKNFFNFFDANCLCSSGQFRGEHKNGLHSLIR